MFHSERGLIISLDWPLDGSTEPPGGHEDGCGVYKLLNSSFLLLQSMAGAFLAPRFCWALSLA